MKDNEKPEQKKDTLVLIKKGSVTKERKESQIAKYLASGWVKA